MFHPTLKIKIYQEDLVFGPGLVILMEHILVTESMKDAVWGNGNVLQQRLEDHQPGRKRTGL